jgi:hypothetical protein
MECRDRVGRRDDEAARRDGVIGASTLFLYVADNVG